MVTSVRQRKNSEKNSYEESNLRPLDSGLHAPPLSHRDFIMNSKLRNRPRLL